MVMLRAKISHQYGCVVVSHFCESRYNIECVRCAMSDGGWIPFGGSDFFLYVGCKRLPTQGSSFGRCAVQPAASLLHLPSHSWHKEVKVVIFAS